MQESEFDKIVAYTLRVELLNGKVLIYPIDTETKQYLKNKLDINSDGIEQNTLLRFIWFRTSLDRMVIINIASIARITFCFDSNVFINNPNAYYDNFNLVEKDVLIEEKETKGGEVQLHVVENEYLPQIILYHSGKAPDDGYDDNPLTYSSLNEFCLSGFSFELEGDIPFRQFLNLIDDDGEETFIPLQQLVVMEFNKNLLFEDDEEEEGDEEDDEEEDGEEDEEGDVNEEDEFLFHKD